MLGIWKYTSTFFTLLQLFSLFLTFYNNKLQRVHAPHTAQNTCISLAASMISQVSVWSLALCGLSAHLSICSSVCSRDKSKKKNNRIILKCLSLIMASGCLVLKINFTEMFETIFILKTMIKCLELDEFLDTVKLPWKSLQICE